MKRAVRILLKSVGLLSAIVFLLPSVWSSMALADEPIVGLWYVTWTDATSRAVVLKVWDVGIATIRKLRMIPRRFSLAAYVRAPGSR